MRTVMIMMLTGVLAGCASPVDKPCGVIRDSLSTVQATTVSGQQRLDVHHARGKAAGCW